MIYLYVKRHAVTGLKYFGRTISKPEKCLGSGVYWNRHIAIHGIEHVATDQIFEFESQEDCTEFAIQFSHENNIVESDAWANLIVENGLPGGDLKGFRHSLDTRRKISEAVKASLTPEMRLRMSTAKKGKRWSKEHSIKISLSNKGRKCSIDHKRKVSEARRGMKFTDEHRKNLSLAHMKCIQ